MVSQGPCWEQLTPSRTVQMGFSGAECSDHPSSLGNRPAWVRHLRLCTGDALVVTAVGVVGKVPLGCDGSSG